MWWHNSFSYLDNNLYTLFFFSLSFVFYFSLVFVYSMCMFGCDAATYPARACNSYFIFTLSAVNDELCICLALFTHFDLSGCACACAKCEKKKWIFFRSKCTHENKYRHFLCMCKQWSEQRNGFIFWVWKRNAFDCFMEYNTKLLWRFKCILICSRIKVAFFCCFDCLASCNGKKCIPFHWVMQELNDFDLSNAKAFSFDLNECALCGKWLTQCFHQFASKNSCFLGLQR